MKKYIEVNINVCFHFFEFDESNEEKAIEDAAYKAEAILKSDLIIPWRNSPNETITIQMAESEAEVFEL